MIRNILAVIAGLAAGMVLNMVLVMVNASLFLPAGVDMADAEQMKQAIRNMPATAWILVFVAHLGQAFVGGWVAARLGKSHPMTLAMIVGVISLVGGIINAISLSSPAWTWIEMPLYLLAAWFAGRIEVTRRAGTA